MKVRRLGMLLASIMSVVVMLVSGAIVYAQQSSSAHYQVNEVFFGTGGELNACSTSYCSKQAAGETGVGNVTSPSYQAQAGFNTDRAPYIALIVTGGTTDLGVLKTNQASKTTATFSVRTYLAGGYVVKTVANPPTSTLPNHPQLAGLSTPTASSPGTEQFGMNVVANTGFGQNPYCSTSTFCNVDTGKLTLNTNYAQTDKFYYSSTDNILATSTSSSDTTNFTLSYLFNISNLTPAGFYEFDQTIVATSTY